MRHLTPEEHLSKSSCPALRPMSSALVRAHARMKFISAPPRDRDLPQRINTCSGPAKLCRGPFVRYAHNGKPTPYTALREHAPQQFDALRRRRSVAS